MDIMHSSLFLALFVLLFLHKTQAQPPPTPALATPPTPLYFFPLTDNNLASSATASNPVPVQIIPSRGVQWVLDGDFGQQNVIDCDSSRASYLSIALPPNAYGQSGRFAISFWFKPRIDQTSFNASALYAYVYSHTSESGGINGANAIHMYLPLAHENQDSGALRVIVRDSQDGALQDSLHPTYLDSDGCVAVPTCPQQQSTYNFTRPPSSWYHVTLTTQTYGKGKGLQLYIDGRLVAQMTDGTQYLDADGVEHTAVGGAPIYLDGPLTLCARSDLDSHRFFSGNVAHLMIFNDSLTGSQVEALYEDENFILAQGQSNVGGPMDDYSMGNMNPDPFLVSNTETPAALLLPPPAVEQDLSSDDTLLSYARGSLQSINGSECQIPLFYHGIRVDNCVDFDEGAYCWLLSGRRWEHCASDALWQDPQPGTLNAVGPSTVPVLRLKQVQRFTVDGDTCQLPTVTNDGTIVEDCIMMGNIPSCITASGEYKECDLGDDDAKQIDVQEDKPVTLYIGKRHTLHSGARCIFPAVAHGYLWFDCPLVYSSSIGMVNISSNQFNVLQNTVNSSVLEVCPTVDGTWQECAPSNVDTLDNSVTNLPVKALHVDHELKARDKEHQGSHGHMCNLDSNVPESSFQKCALDQNLTCLPVPRLVNSTVADDSPVYHVGFCAPRPAGTTFGVFSALHMQDVPQPIAFFPLTGGTLDALTLPGYHGNVIGSSDIVWEDDVMFESIPVCNRTQMNAIRLDNVPYGVFGPWTISLWMRRILGRSQLDGNTFQYLFSHAASTSSPGYSPNEVHIYVADSGHPANGSVRAIAKGNDGLPTQLTYIDSNNVTDSINTTSPTPISSENMKSSEKSVDVNDGKWHMIVLTTTTTTVADHQDTASEKGGMVEGHAMYIDGNFVAATSSKTLSITNNTTPSLMSSDIILCARSDLGSSLNDTSTNRYYDGAIANLMLFDAALDANQIKLLYNTYNPGYYKSSVSNDSDTDVTAAGSMQPQDLEAKDSGAYSYVDNTGLSAGAVAGIVLASIGGAFALLSVLFMAVNAVRQRRRQNKFERFYDTTTPPLPFPPPPPPPSPLSSAHKNFTLSDNDNGLENNDNSTAAPYIGKERKDIGSSTIQLSSEAMSSPKYTNSIVKPSTISDTVEIESGKRKMFGWKKGETRIVLPPHAEDRQIVEP